MCVYMWVVCVCMIHSVNAHFLYFMWCFLEVLIKTSMGPRTALYNKGKCFSLNKLMHSHIYTHLHVQRGLEVALHTHSVKGKNRGKEPKGRELEQSSGGRQKSRSVCFSTLYTRRCYPGMARVFSVGNKRLCNQPLLWG